MTSINLQCFLLVLFAARPLRRYRCDKRSLASFPPGDIGGLHVEVAYTADYIPGRVSFQFSAEPNPLSQTGFWHSFAPHDAVEAIGRPQAFAGQIAAAKMVGAEAEFMEGFEGRALDGKTRKKVVGGHMAAVAEQADPATEQRTLFT